MDFIKQLEEARLIRTAADKKKLTYTDCVERLYLSVLIIELLRKNPEYEKNARSYAADTCRYRGYDRFRIGASDLHNFIYLVSGPEEAQELLRNPTAAKAAAKQTSLPVNQLNGYLEKIKAGGFPSNASQLLIKLESGLKITNADYKTIRRGISTYDTLSGSDRKKLVTRLLYAARAKLRSSDIIDDLEKLAVEKDLETRGVADTEPTVSVPDLAVGGTELVNYRYLVGSKNLALTKHFLDHAKNGNAVPGQMIAAYLPVITMIDNIVKGGPSFIQQLKVLEKRAKNSNK